MAEELQPMQPFRYNRACGHPNDAILYVLLLDGTVKVYCSGCVIQIMEERFGLKPTEIITAEEFAKKYLGAR